MLVVLFVVTPFSRYRRVQSLDAVEMSGWRGVLSAGRAIGSSRQLCCRGGLIAGCESTV